MNARSPKAKGVIDSSRLSGPEKAAVVLLALGEDHAGVWRQLDEEEIKVISQAMSGLGQVTSNVVEDLLVEFVSGMSGTGAIMGSFEQTQRLLASFMGADKVARSLIKAGIAAATAVEGPRFNRAADGRRRITADPHSGQPILPASS